MATEPKPKSALKKERRGAPREEFVAYVVAIDGWDWSYTLLLNDDKRPVDPYHEFRHLRITGKLLRPIGQKTDKVELTLLPKADDDEDRRTDHKPLSVGSLEMICTVDSKIRDLYAG